MSKEGLEGGPEQPIAQSEILPAIEEEIPRYQTGEVRLSKNDKPGYSGFGFIRPDQGETDLYFNADYAHAYFPKKGEHVEFTLPASQRKRGGKGPHACEVAPINPPPMPHPDEYTPVETDGLTGDDLNRALSFDRHLRERAFQVLTGIARRHSVVDRRKPMEMYSWAEALPYTLEGIQPGSSVSYVVFKRFNPDVGEPWSQIVSLVPANQIDTIPEEGNIDQELLPETCSCGAQLQIEKKQVRDSQSFAIVPAEQWVEVLKHGRWIYDDLARCSDSEKHASWQREQETTLEEALFALPEIKGGNEYIASHDLSRPEYASVLTNYQDIEVDLYEMGNEEEDIYARLSVSGDFIIFLDESEVYRLATQTERRETQQGKTYLLYTYNTPKLIQKIQETIRTGDFSSLPIADHPTNLCLRLQRLIDDQYDKYNLPIIKIDPETKVEIKKPE